MPASTPQLRAVGACALVAVLTAGTLATSATAAFAEPAAAPPQGHVVLIGGAITPGNAPSEEIMQRIVDLAQTHAGAGNTPRVAVITAASEVAPNAVEAADGDEYDNATANGLYYQAWFEAHGAAVYPVPIDVNPGEDYPGDPYSADNAFASTVADEIRASDAIYFGGGDQTNYVRSLFECTAPSQAEADIYAYTACSDTPAMAAIREVVESGGVTAGTSAGLTIQQGADMISGGEPYESWRDGATPGWFADGSPGGPGLAYIPAGGLGFFSEGTLDSHFARRDRQPRVVRLALQTGHDRSFGVEEKTALVVDRGARTGEVIGQLGATLLDTSGATSDGRNAAGIRYSYFMTGSTIDFATGAITLAQPAQTAPGTDAAPAAEEDVWKSYECDSDPYIFGTLTLAQTFVKSTASRASGDSCDAAVELPRFRTTFNRDAETQWSADGSFAGLAMTISGVPSLAATAQATEATLPVGNAAQITITVTNTGGTALADFQVNGAPAAASAALVQPGEQVTLTTTHSVALGAQTFEAAVSATATDAAGAQLNLDQVFAPAPATVSLTGVAAPSGNSGGSGAGGAQAGGGAKQPGALSNTGAPDQLGTGILVALLLAGAAALLARGRRTRRA